jgi:hypothetical protein
MNRGLAMAKYALSLGSVAFLANGLLLLFNQRNWEVYFTVNVLIYMATTLLHTKLDSGTRTVLNVVGSLLFCGFVVVLAVRVMDIVLKG